MRLTISVARLLLPLGIALLCSFFGVWMANTDPLITKIEISTVSNFLTSFYTFLVE
jgi:hypothetical protein